MRRSVAADHGRACGWDRDTRRRGTCGGRRAHLRQHGAALRAPVGSALGAGCVDDPDLGHRVSRCAGLLPAHAEHGVHGPPGPCAGAHPGRDGGDRAVGGSRRLPAVAGGLSGLPRRPDAPGAAGAGHPAGHCGDLARHRPRADHAVRAGEARARPPGRHRAGPRRGDGRDRLDGGAAPCLCAGWAGSRSVLGDRACARPRLPGWHAHPVDPRPRRAGSISSPRAMRRSWRSPPRSNTAYRALSCSPFRSSCSPGR